MEVLLFTPGLDSFIADVYLTSKGHKYDKLYFDLDSKYSEFEIAKIVNKAEIVSDITLGHIEREDACIPNRNLLLATLANSRGYNKIWIGGSKSDRVSDNNELIFKRLSKILTNSAQQLVTIDSPFWDVYKSDMLTWLVRSLYPMSELEIGKMLLNETFSCYHPFKSKQERKYLYYGTDFYNYQTHECLNCSACFRKNVIMNLLHITIPFYDHDIICKYGTEFDNCLVDTPRSISTMSYIKELELRENRFHG